VKRLLGLLAALFGLGLVLAAPALAHASVVGSDPVDGTRLQAPPRQVTVSFSESVGLGKLGYLHVTDQKGNRVDAGRAFHPGGTGSKVADRLKAGLPDGTYTASFRVVSQDSHPVAGTIRFVVGNGPLVKGSVSATSSADPGVTQLFAITRWVSYAGLALLAGAWLVLAVWPAGRDDRSARRLIWGGWAAAGFGAVFELLMQGPYSAGAGVGRLFSWTLLDDTLHSNYGQLHSLRLVLLGAIALFLARSLQPDAEPARWEAGAGAVFVAVTWTFSGTGHAATTDPAWLSEADDMLHILAMATWLGGLMMLLRAVLPRREPDELRTVLPVFSRVALIAVTLLAATGTYSAIRGVGTVDALFSTGYGLLVVFKVVLLGCIVGAASLARRMVHRRLVRPTVAYAMTEAALQDEDAEEISDDEVAVERLRRSVFVEALLAFVVLALTGLLVSQPRGKEALAADHRKPVEATAQLGGGRTATVTADPGVHGPVNVTVALSKGPAPTQVTATATQKAKQIGPLPIKLTKEGAGLYDGSATLPVAGQWEIDLVVTTSEFDATTTDVTVRLH
jgi:copper transport protein